MVIQSKLNKRKNVLLFNLKEKIYITDRDYKKDLYYFKSSNSWLALKRSFANGTC